MKTAILLIILTYIFWLFIKSKNNFFFQNREILAEKRQLLQRVLEDRGLTQNQINDILEVYDIFVKQKRFFKFDGAK